MERNSSNSLKYVLMILEKGGSLVKLKETVFVFDSDGLCLFKITQLVLLGILKDGRTGRLQGEMCTEYKFYPEYIITPSDDGE